jgi:tetratricopeptide (TPR) repeat protein
VAQDPTSASLMALAFFYVDAERYDDAVQAFRAAGTKDSKTYAAWYQIGRISGISRSNYDEGVESLQRYLASGELPDTMPSFGWAHLRLGDLYQHEGRVDLARSEYQAAADLRGDDARLASELKLALSQLNRGARL